MVSRLDNDHIDVAEKLHALFQSSYAVEAKILGATNFPPLKRPIESYTRSNNAFYGVIENGIIAGAIEIEHGKGYVDINSLVVAPNYFRRSIASKLLTFTFEHYDVERFVVETGVKNIPAIKLYQKFGFTEIRQWETDFGIRKVQFERKILS